MGNQFRPLIVAAGCMLGLAVLSQNATTAADRPDYATAEDRALAQHLRVREADWRVGSVVYQVLVDRFAPSAELAAKKHLYPAPKRLRDWSEVPRKGQPVDGSTFWSHEIDFWGGDLASLSGKLGYIQSLGVDVLYLNPIHHAYTNHKYDAMDYKAISPEYGTRDDLRGLTDAVHKGGMKIVLDGVFNHMGKNAPTFIEARENPDSPYRDWYVFDKTLPDGYRAWAGAGNLPELNVENPDVQTYLYGAEDSVVRGYLKDGVDGWRLDVAYDLGFNYLTALRNAAHDTKPGSLVIGELWNYPDSWFQSVDGVMNFPFREIIMALADGTLEPRRAMQMIDRLIADSGLDNILKSWLVLDNHDTPRLTAMFPNRDMRRLAQILQFTLPGAPNLYYGTELGMTGGEDPENRAPMTWDKVTDDNPALRWTKRLIALRKENRALRIGEFRSIDSDALIAYERYTDRIGESIFVFANPSNRTVTETIMIPNAKLMSGAHLKDILGSSPPLYTRAALGKITLAPYSVAVFRPDTGPKNGYSQFKRLQ